MKLKQLFLAVAIIYSAAIVYYSLVTEEEFRKSPLELTLKMDSFLVHLLAYLVLAVLWRGAGSAMLTSFILAVAIGGSLEFTQLFLPFRSASVMDFLANSLGSFVGGVVVPVIKKKF